MSPQSILTSCLLLTLLVLGCSRASSQIDVGARYTVPAGTGPQTIDGVTYAYVATPERRAAIIAGYSQLKVGQTREEVRALLGPPDVAIAMRPRASDRFLGWHYLYDIRTIHNWTHVSDQRISVMFDLPNNRLYWAKPSAIPGLTDVGGRQP